MSTEERRYVEGATQPARPSYGRTSPAGISTGEKPFFLTSEFITMVALIAALAIAGAVADLLDASKVWTLITVVAAAYILSRGLSKIRGDTR